MEVRPVQNPSIVFSDEGLYSIQLKAIDGGSSDTETKNNYIRVLPGSSTIPYWEGFESYSSLEFNQLGGDQFK